MSRLTLAAPHVHEAPDLGHKLSCTDDPASPRERRPNGAAALLNILLTVAAAAGVLISLVVLVQPQSGAASLPAALPGIAPAPARGRPAPDFSLPLLDGSQLTLSDLRGKAVLLNFWATWCPPCRTEMPDLEAVWREREKDGLVIVGVDLGESPSTIHAFVTRVSVTYPIALDLDQRIGVLYATSSLPTTYFIDASGTIQDRYTGGMNKRLMTSKLAPLLP